MIREAGYAGYVHKLTHLSQCIGKIIEVGGQQTAFLGKR
jgi:hypothetical protein